MRRREFIALVGGVAAAWSQPANAQRTGIPVVGFLNGVSAEEYGTYVGAFRKGLSQAGFIEGQNVAIEYRWAQRQYDRLPSLAAELVARRVAVIVAAGTPRAAIAAEAATSTIPIVFNSGGDPVEAGLVGSLNRPGANATGVSMMSDEVVTKKLELLHETVPQAKTIAYLNNPNGRATSTITNVQSAARTLGIQLNLIGAAGEREFERAFETLVQQKSEALIVSADPIFLNHHKQLVTLATRYRVPAIYSYRDVVADGGLMSYGASLAEVYLLMGSYAGRILKGDKPTELPVLRPTKFEFVINLKTAKALDLDIPLKLHAFADEVIE